MLPWAEGGEGGWGDGGRTVAPLDLEEGPEAGEQPLDVPHGGLWGDALYRHPPRHQTGGASEGSTRGPLVSAVGEGVSDEGGRGRKRAEVWGEGQWVCGKAAGHIERKVRGTEGTVVQWGPGL